MKKYAYGGPGRTYVKKNWMYFFFAWNAFGLVAYQWYKMKKEKRDDKWSAMTSSMSIFCSCCSLERHNKDGEGNKGTPQEWAII